MKTTMSFGGRIQKVYAAVMRRLFPRFCVKSLTLKSRDYGYLFLPGSKTELDVIRELGDKADKSFLQNRYWSLETKVELLKSKNDALAHEVTTVCEFEAAYNLGNVQLISSVMRVFTPNRSRMLTMLKDKNVSLVTELARCVPTAFSSLSPREILGVEKNELLSMDLQWAVARALAQNDSGWAVMFLNELVSSWGGELNELENLVRFFFLNAIKRGENVSKVMPFVYKCFPSLAVEVREVGRIRSYKFFADCYDAIFSEIVAAVKKDDGQEILWNRSTIKSDAMEWLRVGLFSNDKDIISIFVRHIKLLQARLSEENAEYLLDFLCQRVCMPWQIGQLLPFVKEEHCRQQLFALLVNISQGSLENYFPFTGWKEETVKAAIASMAAANTFPCARISELSDELQKYAVEEMECQSQIVLIRNYKHGGELPQIHLYPKAEKELLMREYEKDRLAYVQNYRMCMSSFLYLLGMQYSQDNVQLICQHAQKWKLTKEEYYALLQSSFRAHAPFLASHVEK